MGFTTPLPAKEAVDLSWVEFSEDEAQPCMSLLGCDREAVWKTVYDIPCSHYPNVFYWCEEDGLLIQNYMSFPAECRDCGAYAQLLSHRRWKKGSK